MSSAALIFMAGLMHCEVATEDGYYSSAQGRKINAAF